ncbi:MAG TPA: hypothetical protein VNO70_12705, partial [Blastocatellia bacterium]|nr:hypothetical protein [Blastocatellia bacterium]
MTSQAVQDYHRLLESEPGLLEESRAYLLDRFREVRLVFGGRTLSPYLRPHFVTDEEWRRISDVCGTIWGAIETVGRVAPSDALMFEQLGFTDGERDLIAIDPGYPNVSVTSRLDSFLTPETYHFVELNAECPAGIAYADVASEIFLDLPVMRRFRQSHDVKPMFCRQHLLNALLTIYSTVRG